MAGNKATMLVLTMVLAFMIARTAVKADTCADNMIYMDLCTQWAEMCANSAFLQEKCPRTCNVCEPIDCAWAEWGNYTDCSQTCGGGFQTRSRIVGTTAQYGGAVCPGDAFESQVCNEEECPVDCEWDVFGDWSECSESCGGGTEFRVREVKIPAQNGGRSCHGEARDERQCNVHNCAVNCEFADWGDYTTCTTSCGGGTQFRSRGVKVSAAFGGDECQGDTKESQDCNAQACPIDCEWDVWSEWETCSVTCGGGMSTRTRNIKIYPQFGGAFCEGQAAEMNMNCNNETCPRDCKWTAFGAFSDCSESCDQGQKTRVRTVEVEADPGGLECHGVASQVVSCKLQNCGIPCEWGDFGDFDTCSKSCGGGEQTRTRIVAIKAAFGGAECDGAAEETQACNEEPCPVPIDCVWGEFGDWTECTKTCGNGNQIRTRVVAISALNGGQECDGTNTDFRPCNEFPCPVDCEWGDWGSFSYCDKDCGGGTQLHNRRVFQEALFGGKPCAGETEEEQACNENPCATNCLWDEFGDWSSCTEECGGGTETRVRDVKQQAAYGGMGCSGYSTESRNCNEQPCQVDCEWSSFAEWSSCSQSCGGGEQTRSRVAATQQRNGGLACAGLNNERRTCNLEACPVACVWGPYSDWVPCSQDCGGGYQMRTRHVITHAASGGQECPGCGTDSRACNLQQCAGNCRWAPWGVWSECTESCGGGTQDRNRTISQAAANGGQECTGDFNEYRDCNTQLCPIDCEWGLWSEYDTCTRTCGGGMHARVRSIRQKARYGGAECEGETQEMEGCNMDACPICKDSPRYARFCPTWTAYCSNSDFVKGCCAKSCRLC